MKRFITVLLGSALTLLGVQGAWAADDDEAIEEVVVTGSYLKRSAADSPSPLSVVTSADIEDIGAADVAEVIASMPWSSGSQTRAATFQGEGADGRANVNLTQPWSRCNIALGQRQATRTFLVQSTR